jgi:hypothetical protein
VTYKLDSGVRYGATLPHFDLAAAFGELGLTDQTHLVMFKLSCAFTL